MKKFLIVFILSLVSFASTNAQDVFVKFDNEVTYYKIKNTTGKEYSYYKVSNDIFNDSIVTVFNAYKDNKIKRNKFYNIPNIVYKHANLTEYQLLGDSTIISDNIQLTVNENKFPLQNDTIIGDYEIYCEVVAQGKLLSNKVTITIDYGQYINFWNNKGAGKVYDEVGKQVKFNSVIDACNYMSRNGWLFVNAYPVTIGKVNVYHYLFRKVIKQEVK